VNASRAQAWEGTRLIGSAEDIVPATKAPEAQTLSFDQLVAIYEERVRRLAYRLLGWRDEVDDVTQDVFFAAFRATPRFRGDAQLWTWLMRITINQCRTRQRKRLVRWNGLKALIVRQRHLSATASLDQTDARDEMTLQVHNAVNKLRPKDREVIVLYYLEEMDVKSMSELLGTSISNVNVRLHRARERLRGPLSDLMKD